MSTSSFFVDGYICGLWYVATSPLCSAVMYIGAWWILNSTRTALSGFSRRTCSFISFCLWLRVEKPVFLSMMFTIFNKY